MWGRMVMSTARRHDQDMANQQLVRVSAKELTSLILDEERLRAERSDRKNWKSRVTGIEEYQPQEEQSQRRPNRDRPQRAQRADEEDAEYKLAIEASKYQEEEDRKKRQSRGGGGEPDDDDLAKAIKLSKEEEELRRRELEDQNASSLFDDDPIQTAQPTGFNQGYQQQTQVDWAGNPIDQGMQQQQTGYMGNMYTGFQQQQPTGYQNGYSNGFAAQPTGFDPYAQQQQQQQPQHLQPQQTSFNPYGQQNQFQQQQQQPEPLIPANTNNPWATNTQPMAMKPTPTGSNNPFATNMARPQTATPSKPSLATLQEQKTATFNNNSNASSFNPIASYAPPPKEQDPHHARLNALLSSGDGMDTFGNTGEMRIPSQHTAPGTFVNSAGAGLGRLTGQATGTNPFLQSQYTGMPQTQYGGNQTAGHQFPAATGPAGMSNGFGGGFGAQQSANPFGARPQQQGQNGQNGQGNDLIQF